METRKSYRRGRRYRKTGYRHPKWKPRTRRVYCEEPDKKGRRWKKVDDSFRPGRPDGWLPPSLQSKLDHHVEIISRYLRYLPVPDGKHLKIEVGRFDMARMQDPTVHGELYQRGPMYDSENVKAYVFARDEYKCQCCKAAAGTRRKDGTAVKIRAHHVLFKRRGATDTPEYMATVCDACHTPANHQEGGILYQWMKEKKSFTRGLWDASFMNILRRKLFQAFPDAVFTYGNITAADRERLHIKKSHANDAIAISLSGTGFTSVRDACQTTTYRQVRSKKRSLHEATPRKGRKTPNRTSRRNCKNVKSVNGFHLWDSVLADGQKLYIKGFTGTSVYLVDREGEYVFPAGKTYKQWSLSKLTRLHPNSRWIMT